MSSTFKRQIRELKLWQFIDRSLTTQDTILQSDVFLFTENHQLGSNKTILSILNEVVENKMIEEVEIPPQGRGRPKKGYTSPQKREDETILINLGNLPCPLSQFIDEQSTSQKQGKSEIITQLLAWSFLQYQHGIQDLYHSPKDPIPPHLRSSEIKRDSLRSL